MQYLTSQYLQVRTRKLHDNVSKTHVVNFRKSKIAVRKWETDVELHLEILEEGVIRERKIICGDNVWTTVWLPVF